MTSDGDVKRSMQIYVDGQFFSRETARVSVFDHGFLYGDGVFEGMRIYHGRVFRLEAHIDRLYRSAHGIALDIPLSRQEMAAATLETVRRNELTDGYIRLVVSRGIGDLGLNPAKCETPTVIIIASTIELYPPEVYESGLKVITCSTRRTPPQCLSGALKCLNYLNNIMAALELRGTGANEGIMLTVDGYLCECTADNIFLVYEGRLKTPCLGLGALAGITRGVVIELAREMGLEVEEGFYTLYDVHTAEEMFLTGSGAEVVPVVLVDGRSIGDGRPGAITQRLMEKFRQRTLAEGTPVS